MFNTIINATNFKSDMKIFILVSLICNTLLWGIYFWVPQRKHRKRFAKKRSANGHMAMQKNIELKSS